MTPRIRLVALCGVQFVDVLGVTSAIAAIPAMLRGVSAGPAATPILATAYAACFGGLLVVGARLGDRYGHRRLVLIGLALFILAGLLGTGAVQVTALIAARAVQGAAAALSVPSALRLLLDGAPREPDRRRALAFWSASGAAAGVSGFLLGGVLTHLIGWRAVFGVNLLVGPALIAAVVLAVSRTRRPPERGRVDLLGAAFLIAALMVLIAGVAVAEQPGAIAVGGALALAGLALGGAFALQQRLARTPLVPRAAWRAVNLRTGTSVAFVNTATTSSTGVLATLFLQQRLGVSPLGAGLSLLPFSLGVIGGSTLSRPLGRHLPARRLAALGLTGIAAGNLFLALTVGSRAAIVAGVLLCGAGLGLASVGATTIGTDVEPALQGAAAGVLNTGAQVGTALGVASLLLVAVRAGGPPSGTAIAWCTAGSLAGLGALLLTVPRRWRVRSSAPARSGRHTRPPARDRERRAWRRGC